MWLEAFPWLSIQNMSRRIDASLEKRSILLEPLYDDVGRRVAHRAVLNADETGWRFNGITPWLWCFTTKTLCYSLITKNRASPNARFTFLEYENVSPYNNHAEQQMRKSILTRKISQQKRSEQGAKTHAILMSLFHPAKLQGNNPVETVMPLPEA